MIPIPGYLSVEAWEAFVEMRKAMPKSKPFTVYAAKLILKRLQAMKDAGHDPNASLDQSIMFGWAGVFEPKDQGIQRAKRSEVESTKTYLESRAAVESSEESRQKAVLAMRQIKLKRVA